MLRGWAWKARSPYVGIAWTSMVPLKSIGLTLPPFIFNMQSLHFTSFFSFIHNNPIQCLGIIPCLAHDTIMAQRGNRDCISYSDSTNRKCLGVTFYIGILLHFLCLECSKPNLSHSWNPTACVYAILSLQYHWVGPHPVCLLFPRNLAGAQAGGPHGLFACIISRHTGF